VPLKILSNATVALQLTMHGALATAAETALAEDFESELVITITSDGWSVFSAYIPHNARNLVTPAGHFGTSKIRPIRSFPRRSWFKIAGKLMVGSEAVTYLPSGLPKPDWLLQCKTASKPGNLFPCHSLLLCSVSPVLRDMSGVVKQTIDEKTTVPFPGDPQLARSFLEWIYNQQKDLTVADVPSLAQLGHMWNIQGGLINFMCIEGHRALYWSPLKSQFCTCEADACQHRLLSYSDVLLHRAGLIQVCDWYLSEYRNEILCFKTIKQPQRDCVEWPLLTDECDMKMFWRHCKAFILRHPEVTLPTLTHAALLMAVVRPISNNNMTHINFAQTLEKSKHMHTP